MKMEDLNIHQEIAKARPKLLQVSPFVARIFMGFAITNIVLGFGLFISQVGDNTRRLPVINDFITLKFYGVVFFVLGLVMIYAYVKNSWRLMRSTLVCGIFLKSVWLYALVWLALHSGSITLLSIWAFFSYSQILTYIYFSPKVRISDGKQ